MKIFLSLTTIAALSVGAASAAEQYDPGYDLTNVLGLTASFTLGANLCREKFPEYRSDISKAFEHWKKRNDPTIRDVTQRLRAQLSAFSKREKEDPTKIEGAVKAEVNALAKGQRDNYLKLPHSELRGICEALSEKLESENFDLENLVKDSLDNIRKQPGAQ